MKKNIQKQKIYYSFERLIQKNLYFLKIIKIYLNQIKKFQMRNICILCSTFIKKEKPFFCYSCQKIFHEKCLKDWDEKCKRQNKTLTCPNCRNELPFEKWNKKLDYEDDRKFNANLMNEINKLKNNKK